MYQKPYEISNIKQRKVSQSKSIGSNKTCKNDIFTPFGVVRSFTYCNNDYNLSFKRSWDFFFRKFLESFKLEINDGMIKVLENINSIVDHILDRELTVIGALSGSNNCDHVISFNVLEQFLNSSGQPYTIFLDHEKIGVEGLSIPKLLDKIWLEIKSRFLDLLLEEIKSIDLRKGYQNEKSLLIGSSTNLNDSKRKSDEKLVDRVKRNRRKSIVEYSRAKSIQLDLENKTFGIHYTNTNDLYNWKSTHSIPIGSEISKSLSSYNNQKFTSITKGLNFVGSIFKTKKKNNLKIRPIVILIPSCEYFAPGQLGQLLEILSQFKETYKIPFTTVLGISTNTLYVQQIIGQIFLNKLKFVSVKLLDSKKVFYKSIINSLFYLDDFTSNILHKCDYLEHPELNLENYIELKYLYSNSITYSESEFFPFPLISAACIKQIKDNFFQYDYSISSSLKTIFKIFQFYFSNNDFNLFCQQINEIDLNYLSEHMIDQLKLKYQINGSILSPEINGRLKEATIIELFQLKLNLKFVTLGLCILNIIFCDMLNIFDINERYNLIIEWLEILEKNMMKELVEKISNLSLQIKNANNTVNNTDFIFSKINNINKLFLARNKLFLSTKNIISDYELEWSVVTFEQNISKLFIPSIDKSKPYGYISDNIFHSFINVSYNASDQQLDYLLDEIMTPNFTPSIINELSRASNDENISDDFSTIYQIYSANNGNKINLFKLFVAFCNRVTDEFNKPSSNYTSNIKPKETNNEKLGIHFLPVQYSDLFSRFIKVINTFQFIGLLYLPLKNTKFEQEILQINFDDRNLEKKFQHSSKYLSQYFKSTLGNLYAHKLHWGNKIPISDTELVDKISDYPRNCLFTDEKFNFANPNKSINEINSNINYKRKSVCSDFKSNESDNRFTRKSKLEIIKLRAAESNQSKIIEFKGIKKQRAISSANKIKNLRRSIVKE